MADEDERALVGVERGDERVGARDIEVCARLVHEQQIGRGEEEFREGEARFFAAAEDGDFLVHIVLAEEERAEERARGLLGEAGVVNAQLHRLGEDGVPGVQHIEAVLGKIAGPDVVAEFAGAGLDRHDAGQDFQQGGLARTVGADEHDALAAFRGEMQPAVDDLAAIGLGDVRQPHHPQAAAWRLRKAEMQAGDLGLGRVDRRGEDVRDLLLLRLGARGQRGLGAEAIDETLEVRNLALLVFPGGQLLRLVGLALADEIVVVAVPAPETFAAQFEHAGAQGIEERAVVRDHEHRAGVAGEVVLKPPQRLKVEVIGRLVEHQQVG